MPNLKSTGQNSKATTGMSHWAIIFYFREHSKFGSSALPGLMLDLGLLKISLEGVFF